jgi:membrane protein DedA with SNARE-associated domain
MVHVLERWGYLAVFVTSFVSTMGIPAGAEVAIIYAGVLASGQIPHQAQHLDLVAVIATATGAEVLGSLAGYVIGAVGGRRLLDRFGPYVLITGKDLDRAELWFARHGATTVLFGRLVPFVRSLVSVGAGVSSVPLLTFVGFTVIGCALWCSIVTTVGYGLGRGYEQTVRTFSVALYAAAVVVVLSLVGLVVVRFRSVRGDG